ncbi:ubiquitin carboxyl-terminal hydrolase 25-like [Oscarella lobularis]|uniref:ubiquitin carboxyl-terminal hydrolase 25-like n=1 Tax=Oscarella lobularis TaxID=121494 RepID=UPI0033136A99
MTAKQENEEPLRSAYGDTAESSSWKSSRETPQLAIEARKVKKEEPKPTLIDLTSTEDGDDDVQRAIALSLQDANHISGAPLSREDQDLSRAVEASMADTKGGSTRRRRYDSLLLHIDPLNPHERIRDGTTPVGIENVGNTSWF